MTGHEIRLAARPKGWPTLDTFAHAAVELPPVADGQVLVRNLVMSVDPYMRGRMNDVKSYVPPFQIGQPLEGGAIGEVEESRAANIRAGDIVQSMLGWRDRFVAPASQVRVVDAHVRPLSAHLGALGMPGLTAWVGLKLAECMREHGRIAACGAISRYNDETASPGPRNLFLFVPRRLTMRGFIVTDWSREMKTFLAEVGPLVASGRVHALETVLEGLDQAPAAFLSLLRGGNVGKMIVKIT